VEHASRVLNRAWYAARGVCSFLGVPLLVNGVAAGVMTCMTRSPRAWAPEDVAHAEVLSATAAVAIRNARLHGETQERLSRLRGLTALDRMVTSPEALEQALDRVAETTVEFLGAEVARIWVIDAAAARLRLAVTRSRDPQESVAVAEPLA